MSRLAGRIPAPGRIELVDVDDDRLSPDGTGEILFRPELACLCGSDLPYFDGSAAGYPLEPGLSLHEMIGTVLASNGAKFRPGDRVLAVPVGQRGFFERYVVSEARAIPLDPRPAPEEAVLAQPLGTVLYAFRKMPNVLGLDVAVIGQGPIGQLFDRVLRSLGARRVLAIDRLPERLAASERSGAEVIVDASREDPVAAVRRETQDQGADVVVEAVGHRDQCLDLAIDICRAGGRILSFGVPPVEPIGRLAWSRLFMKNITVQASVNPDFDIDFPLAMRWVAERRIDVADLVTHRFSVREAQRAFDVFHRREGGAQKVLLEFPRS